MWDCFIEPELMLMLCLSQETTFKVKLYSFESPGCIFSRSWLVSESTSEPTSGGTEREESWPRFPLWSRLLVLLYLPIASSLILTVSASFEGGTEA